MRFCLCYELRQKCEFDDFSGTQAFFSFFVTALNFSFASFILFQDKRNRRRRIKKASLFQKANILQVDIQYFILFIKYYRGQKYESFAMLIFVQCLVLQPHTFGVDFLENASYVFYREPHCLGLRQMALQEFLPAVEL